MTLYLDLVIKFGEHLLIFDLVFTRKNFTGLCASALAFVDSTLHHKKLNIFGIRNITLHFVILMLCYIYRSHTIISYN